MRSWLFLAALATASALTTGASAYERQYKLGAGLGYETLKLAAAHDATGGSPALEVDLSYGLTDMFNLFAEASAATPSLTREGYSVPAEKEGAPPTEIPAVTLDGRFTALSGHAGVAYTLDVIRWIPYAGVGLGATHLRHAGVAKTRASGVAAVGLDYAMTRDLQVGAAVRMVTAPGSSESWTSYQGFLRVGYTWGW